MKVTFGDAVLLSFKKFRVFKDTATRREYWFFVLFSVLLGVVLSTIEGIIWPQPEPTDLIEAANMTAPLSNIAALILLLPSLSLTARRLRDAGWSARWLLLWLLPILALGLVTFGLISYLNQVIQPTQEMLVATVAYFVPILLMAFLIQLFLLIICLRPSKSREQGNRYAN